MKPPSSLVRFVGFPLVAAVILLFCAWCVTEWFRGVASWPVGVVALVIAGQTLKAAMQVTRYNAWHKEWETMGDSKPAAKKNASVFWPFIFISMAALFLSNRLWLGEHLVLVIFGYGLVFGLYFFVRWIRRRQPHAKLSKAYVPVSWMVKGGKSSAPSREDAMRSLPDYSAALFNAGDEGGKTSNMAEERTAIYGPQ